MDPRPLRDPGPDPAGQASAREALDRVRAALRELPESEREVFLLRQNGDLPFASVAETLGIPVGTAKTRMRSALRRLRAAAGDDPVGNAEAAR